MSYEQKYKKYKKMYIDLKYNQSGGVNNPLTDAYNRINEKFIVKIPDSDYKKIIDKLRNFCSTQQKGEIQVEQIKGKVKNLFENLGNNNLSELNLKNIFENRNELLNINWQQYYMNLCDLIRDKFIPELKKLQELQRKFIERLGNITTEGKINISKYITFAKNNGMLDRSVDYIMEEYSKNVTNFSNYVNAEKKTNDQVMAYLTSNSGQTNPMSNIGQSNQLMSKSGKMCKTSCTKNHDLLHGNYCSCKTDPYNSFFMSYDWDYCEPSKCNQ
jgi:hypothetical protein